MNLLKLPILFVVVFLISCANVSKAPPEASNAAKDFSAVSDKATVFLYRTGRAMGAANQIMVKVNGIDAGGTGPGSFFKWELNPGTYTFSSSSQESSATIQIQAVAGKVYYIRQDARIGLNDFRVTMKEVDANQGQKEVATCKLLVSAFVPE